MTELDVQKVVFEYLKNSAYLEVSSSPEFDPAGELCGASVRVSLYLNHPEAKETLVITS